MPVVAEYIAIRPDFCGGKPHVAGHRIKVQHIAVWHERLGLSPGVCLAIEDAPAGILSAKAAGMTCWAVRTEYTRDIDLPGPDRVFESLLEFNVDEMVKVAA